MLRRMHPIRNEFINDYFYAGTDGLTISSDSPDRVDIHDRPYFREALATGNIVFSDPVISRLDGRLIIIIANPVQVAGKINSVVSCTMSVNSLDRVLGKDTITKTGRFILLTKDWTVVYHPKVEYIGTRIGVNITDDGKQIAGIMNIISAASGSFFRYVFDG